MLSLQLKIYVVLAKYDSFRYPAVLQQMVFWSIPKKCKMNDFHFIMFFLFQKSYVINFNIDLANPKSGIPQKKVIDRVNSTQ